MKNKARLLLGKLTLIIILLFNVNCEKDEELHSYSEAIETNTESSLKLTEGTFKDLLEKKEFKKAFSEYEDLQNKILLNSTTRKDIDLQNFTIDYSVVKEINYKDRTTYTFSVNRATKKSFYENIVIEKKKEEENITAFLLRYYPKETPAYVKEHDTHSFKGKVVVFKIDPNFNSLAASSNCYSGGEWVCIWGDEEHTAGAKCFAANDGRVYFKEFDGDCTRDEPLGGFGGGGGGNGANNPGPGESDIITSLTFPDGSTYTSKLTSRLSLNFQESNFLNNNRLIAEDILNFLEKNNNVEGEKFAKNALQVLMINPNANPFLGSDCRSFEYAQPPGALQKGCAVTNFNHTFYTAGISSDGSPYYDEIESIVDIAYFTMPVGMTNGRAANLTAIAVTTAIKATDLYYAENPRISKFTLGEYFKNRINQSLSAVGGSVNTTSPPFNIPSPAPYITSILGLSTPYDCE